LKLAWKFYRLSVKAGFGDNFTRRFQNTFSQFNSIRIAVPLKQRANLINGDFSVVECVLFSRASEEGEESEQKSKGKGTNNLIFFWFISELVVMEVPSN
jgi:hypothetical protein